MLYFFQEIVLWRKGEKTRKPFQAALQQQYKQMQNPQMAAQQQLVEEQEKRRKRDDSEPSSEQNDDEEKENTNEANGDEETLEPEQPTPDKEFRSVINSGGDEKIEEDGTSAERGEGDVKKTNDVTPPGEELRTPEGGEEEKKKKVEEPEQVLAS